MLALVIVGNFVAIGLLASFRADDTVDSTTASHERCLRSLIPTQIQHPSVQRIGGGAYACQRSRVAFGIRIYSSLLVTNLGLKLLSPNKRFGVPLFN